MSCEKCGFCAEELPTVENISVDARARGNYRFASMLDQALERCGVLRENLEPNDREYLKNIARTTKKQSSSDVCTTFLRDAKHIVETTKGRQSSEPTMRETGFANMFAASRGGSSTPTLERAEPAKPRSNSGFLRMFEASKNASSEDAVQRALDEIEQDEAEYRRPTRRGMGFGNMLKASQTGTFEGDETRDDEKPIPCGLAAMLEAMSPKKTHDTLDEKSHVRRGMGFKAMLDGAGKGTE
jgi:hypothetical protein